MEGSKVNASSAFSIISQETGFHSANLNHQHTFSFYISYTHTHTPLYFERKKTICTLTYFFFKMYLGPGLLGEFVPTYKQVVDIVGWKAVGAGVHLLKLGKQLWQMKRKFKTGKRQARQACFKMHISEPLRSTVLCKEAHHREFHNKITIK